MGKVRIPVVDENDEIIGYKEREEIRQDDIYRATGLWIENSKSEVLLAQRSFSKRIETGKWGPAVSGTVEGNETYESNIYKEAQEEIGLVDCDFRKEKKVRIHSETSYFAQWFFVKLDMDIKEFKIKKDEVEQIKWIGREELKKEIAENPEMFVAGMRQNPNLFK